MLLERLAGHPSKGTSLRGWLNRELPGERAAHTLLHLARLTLLNEPSESYQREKLSAVEWSLATAKGWLKLE